ncbi:MAG: zinc finger domain-containing protein [Candidatus Micrarchaeia archaeon]
MIYTCDSCGIRTTNFTEFKCPKCGAIIRRCTECKSNMVKYTCKKCGFEGP